MRQVFIFKPKGILLGTTILSIMFTIFSIGPYLTGGLPMFYGYIIFFGWVIYIIARRKVILYANAILVVQGFKKRLLNYNDISLMQIERYGPPLSKVSYPAITFYYNTKSEFIAYLYYGTYHKEDITKMIDFIIERNAKVTISKEIKEYLMYFARR